MPETLQARTSQTLNIWIHLGNQKTETQIFRILEIQVFRSPKTQTFEILQTQEFRTLASQVFQVLDT